MQRNGKRYWYETKPDRNPITSRRGAVPVQRQGKGVPDAYDEVREFFKSRAGSNRNE